MPQNLTSTNIVNGTTSSTSKQGSGALELPAFLAGSTSFFHWVKLAVIGSVLETLRRFAYSFNEFLVNSFFLTATFDENDDSFLWMMHWLAKQPTQTNLRKVAISTRSFGIKSAAILVPGEDEEVSDTAKGSRRLAYLPSISAPYSFFFNGHRVTVTRSRSTGGYGGYYGSVAQTLEICIMARSHKVLEQLLLEAKRSYLAAQEQTISIYVSDSSNSWRYVASRPKRPLNSIILEPGVKDLLIDDARDFLESKTWYSERGIPFRRGYLLYGAPGSGKTSMIHSMAGELGLDVYVVSLSRVGLDDTGLNELISELPEKCIALMEDIDAAFHGGLNRDAPASPANGDAGKTEPGPPPSSSRITLSGLLNALDGVGAQEGRILYATTNKYFALDPALRRPGRMDLHIEFKLASMQQCLELFQRFYLPSDSVGDVDADADDESDAESSDSGYGSSGEVDSDVTIGNEKYKDSRRTPAPVSPELLNPEKVSFNGTTHRARAPTLTRRQVNHLASRFAHAIPEREFSMASLQGYLMGYKTRPFEAAAEAKAWVEAKLREKAAKEEQNASQAPSEAMDLIR